MVAPAAGLPLLAGDGQSGSYPTERTPEDARPKSACREFHHIGNDKRACGDQENNSRLVGNPSLADWEGLPVIRQVTVFQNTRTTANVASSVWCPSENSSME